MSRSAARTGSSRFRTAHWCRPLPEGAGSVEQAPRSSHGRFPFGYAEARFHAGVLLEHIPLMVFERPGEVSPEIVAQLAARGVRCLGLDAPRSPARPVPARTVTAWARR
jgi:hypothetical protein